MRLFAAEMGRRSKVAVRRASTSTKPSNSLSGSDRLTYPRREAGGPDSLEKTEGPRRIFQLKVCEIELGIRALEHDEAKARAGVHSREYVLEALEHVRVHDVERRMVKHHSPVTQAFPR